MIDLDITFVIQFFHFVITLVVLNFLLISPVREIIKKRKERMAGFIDSADSFANAADDKIANYTQALNEARVVGTETRNTLRDEGAAEEKTILEAANAAAAKAMADERAKVQAEADETMASLKGQVSALADKAVAKVLA